MRCAEKACGKYSNDIIKFSPTVGQGLCKCAVVKCILRWHDGKVPDVCNLLRASKQVAIETPLNLSRTDIEPWLVACISETYIVKHQSPALCNWYLKWYLSLAKEISDELGGRKIARIIANKKRRRQQWRINKVSKDSKAQSVLCKDIPTLNGTLSLDTQEPLKQSVQQNLQQCFSLENVLH